MSFGVVGSRSVDGDELGLVMRYLLPMIDGRKQALIQEVHDFAAI